MSNRSIAAAVGVAVLVLALALVPWGRSPLYRLAGEEGHGPDPIPDAPLDVASFRFGESHAGRTYFVDARDESPLVQGNLKAIGQLYLARGLPVEDPARADFILGVQGTRIVLRPAP